MTAAFHTFLHSLVPGEPVRFGAVTVLPLRGPSRGEPVALLGPDTAEVRERADGAIVGQIEVHNRAPRRLLLLSGEVLVGARQNRLVNASTLVEVGASLALNVSCVERGRWSEGRGGAGFRSSGATAPWHLRSRSSLSSSRSKRARGVSAADQHAVWADVDAHLRWRGLSSRTDDLTVGIDRLDIGAALADWAPGPADLGAALFVGERLVGVEAFGRADTWSAAARRVLTGVFQDAPPDASPPADPAAAWQALRDAAGALTLTPARGDGLGEELHAESTDAHAVALLHDEALVHLQLAQRVPEAPALPPGARRPLRDWREAWGLPGVPADPDAPADHRPRPRLPLWGQRAAAQLDEAGPTEIEIVGPTVVCAARAIGHWGVSLVRLGLLPRMVGGGLAAWPCGGRAEAMDLMALLCHIDAPPAALRVVDPADVASGAVPAWLDAWPGEAGRARARLR